MGWEPRPVPSVAAPARPSRAWLKAGLSLAVVFHLFCVLVIPNFDNSLGMRLSKVVLPYVNLLELTNCWNFFAPNPGAPVYVEWEYLDAHGERLATGRWPDLSERYFLRERLNRRVTAADFMVNSEVRAEKMMVPYLCRQEPRARSLRLWRAVHPLPGMAEVASGKRRIGDEVGAERKLVSHSFCEEAR